MRMRWLRSVALAVVVVVAVTACGSSSAAGGPVKVRLGYLANLTHAAALVGVNKGYFKHELGSDVDLSLQSFNAGPQEVEALNGDAVDAAFFGPGPAINAYTKSHGDLLRIVAGSASGGAALVVDPSKISSPSDLKGKTLSDPQLGNTQDIALRAYLSANGYHTDAQGGGDVTIAPANDNATVLQLFQQKKIDGAWMPEPWSTRLVQEGGGKVLVDEASLWRGGQFATTELVVSKKFLDAHPDQVEALVRGLVKTNDWIGQNPADAKSATNDELAKLTQKKLSDKVLSEAWPHLQFTVDPLARSLKTGLDNAKAAGLVSKSADISSILDLRLLNKVLKAANKPTVDAGDLGQA
jgi:NitT/TauT family transport system substrate-binding protein